MSKIFENIKGNIYAFDPTAAGYASVAPGSILVMDAGLLRPAKSTDTISLANAHTFFLANDYYANATNGFICAICILERFTATLPLSLTLAAGNGLSIISGVWTKVVREEATEDALVIAIITEANGSYESTALPTKMTTMCPKYMVYQDHTAVYHVAGITDDDGDKILALSYVSGDATLYDGATDFAYTITGKNIIQLPAGGIINQTAELGIYLALLGTGETFAEQFGANFITRLEGLLNPGVNPAVITASWEEYRTQAGTVAVIDNVAPKSLKYTPGLGDAPDNGQRMGVTVTYAGGGELETYGDYRFDTPNHFIDIDEGVNLSNCTNGDAMVMTWVDEKTGTFSFSSIGGEDDDRIILNNETGDSPTIGETGYEVSGSIHATDKYIIATIPAAEVSRTAPPPGGDVTTVIIEEDWDPAIVTSDVDTALHLTASWDSAE